jgi:predicted glycosyltransferase
MVRVALYSHDTMGLGHGRRHLLVAQALAGSALRPTVLMIAGTPEVAAFDLPAGVDLLTLPALRKDAEGRYGARWLDVSLEQVSSIRAATIRAALDSFRPDVLVVDNVPRGAAQELNPALEMLRALGRTRCVLGLRDVLDDPITVAREWRLARNLEAIRRFYQAVWVYGEPAVYNPVWEYGFPEDVAARVRFVGYADPRERRVARPPGRGRFGVEPPLPPGRLALCLLGGGQDGAELAEAFAMADLPADTSGLILTGPFMAPEDTDRLHELAARRPRLHVLDFTRDPASLIRRADRVVAMGGYNTTWELVAIGKRALIVPLVAPRREQLIRAERLRDIGLLDLLHPDLLSSAAITTWLATDRPPPRGRDLIAFDGLARLPALLGELLAAPRAAASPVELAALN